MRPVYQNSPVLAIEDKWTTSRSPHSPIPPQQQAANDKQQATSIGQSQTARGIETVGTLGPDNLIQPLSPIFTDDNQNGATQSNSSNSNANQGKDASGIQFQAPEPSPLPPSVEAVSPQGVVVPNDTTANPITTQPDPTGTKPPGSGTPPPTSTNPQDGPGTVVPPTTITNPKLPPVDPNGNPTGVTPPPGWKPGDGERQVTPEDFWSDLANWWAEATKKAQELADAAYKKELEQAAATGDAKAVAAVQAKYTVSNLIKSDPRFNGSDKKNLDEINQHAESLAPQARLDFYLKLGAEVFKGVQDGNVGEVKKTLNALSDDPKKIERWSRWAAEQSPGGQAAIAGLRGTSFLGGLGKLSRTRPSTMPYVRDPHESASPIPKAPSLGKDDDLFWSGISVFTTTLGTSFSITEELYRSNVSPEALAALLLAGGAKPKDIVSAVSSYQVWLERTGKVGKFFDGVGYFIAAGQTIKAWNDIKDSDMSSFEKEGAWAMEFAFGVGGVVAGGVATAKCAKLNGAAGALGCGAASAGGIELTSTLAKNSLKQFLGLNYGK